MNLNNLKKVHFIGISAPFSSFCAQKLISMGVKVTASEINQKSKNAKYWIKKGVLYKGGHNAKYITKVLDLVVYPNGPIPGNVECKRADSLNLKTIALPDLVGVFSTKYKTVAVAGTHGKTTTTGLITWVLHKQNLNPNFIISDADDTIIGLNKNYKLTKSDILIMEACEYKNQFIKRAPKPYISAVTNIDLDHTDFYKSQKDYNQAFIGFLQNTTNKIAINTKGKNEKQVLKKVTVKSQDYIKYLEIAKTAKNPVLPGKHNLENIACAICTCKILGVSEENSIKAIQTFKGVTRRLEYLGKSKNNNLFYKDYAHNPKKVSSLLEGLKESYPNKKIVLVFQPHSLERSNTFKNHFKTSIKRANVVIIPNIFVPTREKTLFKNLVTEKDFAEYIGATYTNGFEKMGILVNKMDKKESNIVFVFASAGDLNNNIPKIYG